MPALADPKADTLIEPVAPHREKVDLSGLLVERSRELGSCYLARALWHRLGLGRQSVDWSHTAPC